MYNVKEINANALLHNYDYIKKISNKKIMVMVKADAYGHGLKNIVSVLKNKVYYWGVANENEAVQLRKLLGKQHNILVVGKTHHYKTLIKNNILITVDCMQDLKKITRCLLHTKKIAKIHIKVNSGMNRLGISSLKHFKQMLQYIKKIKNIKLDGVFTHFFDADQDKNHVKKQLITFRKYINCLPNKNILIHVGGSFATCNKLIKEINMVRSGLFIYGYGNNNLKPVMQIKSKIIKITKTKQNEFVGYGRSQVKKGTKIALIPFGYADGFCRQLFNKGYVYVKNKKCKVLGKVCMDMLMCDITNIKAMVGDYVVVFKNADYFARAIKTSPYEILTNFSKARTTDIIN